MFNKDEKMHAKCCFRVIKIYRGLTYNNNTLVCFENNIFSQPLKYTGYVLIKSTTFCRTNGYHKVKTANAFVSL